MNIDLMNCYKLIFLYLFICISYSIGVVNKDEVNKHNFIETVGKKTCIQQELCRLFVYLVFKIKAK